MVSTVKSRPNYYEMLGLTPSAAGDAIAQAFARATNLFRPQAFGGITELCVAYETLRDPAKRRAYDASLGLPPPKRDLPPVSRAVSAHFMHQPRVAGSPPAPSAERQPEVRAASQHDGLPEPSVTTLPRPAPPIEQSSEPSVSPQPRQAGYDEVNAGFSPIEWKRTGVVVGGLVTAAVFVGAIAGWWSGSDAAEAQPATISAAAPKEEAPPAFSELWREPAPRAVATQAVQPRDMARARRQVERAPRSAQFAASEAEQQLIQPPGDLAGPNEADPLAPEASSVPVVAAAMPLPHKTVARTIDRIGYRCGSVASAAPVEGTSGTYRVTCTSGQSFQAKPVNGRYRFRRLAGN